MLNNLFKRIAMTFLLTALAAGLAQAQGTAFTYQGRLTDGSNPADGMYDMQFKPFDTPTVGTGIQQGMTLTFSTVQIEKGVFTVLLNFGSGIFTGPSRFLEISVRPTGSADPYTILEPRQAITTTPYALRASTAGGADTATNASQLGGIGPGGFIQNTSTQQASTAFNISGNGTLGGTLSANAVTAANAVSGALLTSTGAVNAATQYNIGGSRILGNPGTNNLFAGIAAGQANTTGNNNAFFGSAAGTSNTASSNSFFGSNTGLFNQSGASNSFFGRSAGQANTTGNFNSFFGTNAGLNNAASDNSFFGAQAGASNESGTFNSFFGRNAGQANRFGDSNSFFGTNAGFSNVASSNSFFGSNAGQANTTGNFNSFFGASAGSSNNASNNSFFGWTAGQSNQTGIRNSFFGGGAGQANQTGASNSFFGAFAGETNSSGANNTVIGASGNVGSDNLTNATAIGANALVTANNSLVLGSINTINGATASAKVGIGTTAPTQALDVRDGTGLSGHIQIGAPSTTVAERIITFGDSGCSSCVYIGEQDADDRLVMRAGLFRFKVGSVEPESNGLQRLGGASNRWSEVWASNGTIQTSDARLKRGVADIGYGLADLMRLRPVTFFWKDQADTRRHVGLIAQEAETVIPESVVRSADPAAPLGLNYADLVPVLIKAIQQQQRQIESLKALACQGRSDAAACK